FVCEKAETFAHSYKGEVADFDESQMKQALQDYEEIMELLGKIGPYAQLIWATDTGDEEYGKLVQDSRELSSEVNQQLVFFDVEWLQMEEEKAQRLIESEELEHYQHYLETSRSYKDQVVGGGAEEVMSAGGVTGSGAWRRCFDETLGAARVPVDGEELPQQQTRSKVHSPARELRERARRALTDTFEARNRSLTFVLNTILA